MDETDIDPIPEIPLLTIDASELLSYEFCPRSVYLDTIVRDNAIPMSHLIAKGFFLKNAFRKLIPDERRVGANLEHIEDILPALLPEHLRYKSAESFANAMGYELMYHVNDLGNRMHGREIAWAFKNQWWKMKNEIKTACVNYYNHLLAEGFPILGYSNKEMAFFHDCTKYVVKFSEIRKGGIVGAQKTAKKTQKEIDTHWYITLQLLGLTQLVRTHEALRMKFGFDGSQGQYIDPRARYEYFCLSGNEKFTTTRTDSDLETLLSALKEKKETKEQHSKTGFPPNHKSCYICKYRVEGNDGRPICPDVKGKDLLRPKSYFEKDL
jgi:hypothetical protein